VIAHLEQQARDDQDLRLSVNAGIQTRSSLSSARPNDSVGRSCVSSRVTIGADNQGGTERCSRRSRRRSSKAESSSTPSATGGTKLAASSATSATVSRQKPRS